MNKYLVTFDIETTGLNRSQDQIIQFAAIKLNKETDKIVDELNLKIKPKGSYSISLAAYFKHGITPNALQNEKQFIEVADQITNFFEDSDIITYNGNNFDIPFLISEYERNGLPSPDFLSRDVYDVFLEEKRRNGNKLDETYKRYNNGVSMEESGLSCHDALSDVKATFFVYKAQQKSKEYRPEKMYGEDNAITDMIFCEELVPCFNCGKYRGISVKYVIEHDKSYIDWVLNKSNFIKSTKDYIKSLI